MAIMEILIITLALTKIININLLQTQVKDFISLINPTQCLPNFQTLCRIQCICNQNMELTLLHKINVLKTAHKVTVVVYSSNQNLPKTYPKAFINKINNITSTKYQFINLYLM